MKVMTLNAVLKSSLTVRRQRMRHTASLGPSVTLELVALAAVFRRSADNTWLPEGAHANPFPSV
jgi:hypothetical protein